MAETTDSSNLSADADAGGAPRIRMSEIGFTGLKKSNGSILEEARRELRFPKSMDTYKKMAMDTTLSSAISLYEMMVARARWRVDAPPEATDKEKARAKYVESTMDDMEHSWFDFIKEVSSMFTYGFSVHEKVFRKRLRSAGSRYNDGLVGIKKLPVRSQDSISEWVWSEDGRTLAGLKQSLNESLDAYRYTAIGSTIDLPRYKFMLFRTNAKRDNPEGTSPLKSCYTSWKWRTAMEENEAVGVAREMNGTPIAMIPPRYMSPDASADEKAVYEFYKDMVRNMQNNEQAGIVMPLAYDPDSRQPLFKFELLSGSGVRGYDTSEIIGRYDNKMLMSFFADLLKLGTEKVGSFSLAGAKTSLLAMAIEHRLMEIQTVLNHDLIPQLFALNGWTDERLPKFAFNDLDQEDLDVFSTAIQRLMATNSIELDRPVMNEIRSRMGFPKRPDDEPVAWEDMPNNRSRSGDSFNTASGGLNGTGQGVSSRDNTAANKSN